MSGSEQAFSRVDRLLIAPLVAAGMRKQRKHTAEAHERMLDDLRKILSYMRDDALEALSETIERHALGANRNVWPDKVSILNWARALQEPPEGQGRLVRNFMASDVARRFYEDEGTEGAIALRRFLLRQHRAPCKYGWTLIGQNVDELRRRRALLRERGAEISDQERAWLVGFEQAGEECRALMFPKRIEIEGGQEG